MLNHSHQPEPNLVPEVWDIKHLLESFGVNCEVLDKANDQLEIRLPESFQKIKDNDFLTHEISLIQESEKIGIPREEYCRLYKVWKQQQNPLIKTWRFLKLNQLYQWFGDDKKPWDFVQLLATISIPIVLTVGTTYLTTERTKQETLEKYLEFMSKFLAEENVNHVRQQSDSSKPPVKVWIIPRARTLAVLRELDDSRKVQVLQFLNESGLLDGVEPDVDLKQADLKSANLTGINLNGANLSLVDFSNANLSRAKLVNAKLTEATLLNINLNKADLRGADLSNARLSANFDLSNTSALLCDTISPNGEKVNRDCVELGYIDTPTGRGLNIRSGPGYKYPVIGSFPEGSVIFLVGPPVYADGLAWQRLPQGGWVAGDKE